MGEVGDVERRRASRFLVAVLGILAAAIFLLLGPILSGLVFGLVVGFLLQEPYRRAARATRLPRLVAVLMVILLCVALDVPLFLLGWELLREARGFADALQSADFLPSIARGLTRLGLSEPNAAALVQQASADVAAWVHAAALPTLSFTMALLMNMGVFLFVLYYTLVGGQDLVDWTREALPLPPGHATALIEAVGDRMRNLFLGTFLVAVSLGVLSGIVWWLLGFPNPVFWGAVMTVFSLIPALGTGIVQYPAAAVAFFTGRVWQGAALLGWAIVAAPIVGNVIRAAFVGKTHGVHPAIVLVGTVGGLGLFGPSGFLLGPLLLSMVDPVLGAWRSIRPADAEVPRAG